MFTVFHTKADAKTARRALAAIHAAVHTNTDSGYLDPKEASQMAKVLILNFTCMSKVDNTSYTYKFTSS